jgi:hypothetical protein
MRVITVRGSTPMAAIAGEDQRLVETDGFVVESSDGDVGLVEEVWLGEANEPHALAVRTSEGRHGLLLGEDVLAVDRENHWVVVSPETVLLELGAPRLQTTQGEDGATRQTASWTTTGDVVPLAPPPRRRWRFPVRLSRLVGEDQLPRAVAVLLTSIVLLVALVLALAFLVARLLTGAAY